MAFAELDTPPDRAEKLASEWLERADERTAPIDIAKVAQAMQVRIFEIRPKSPTPLIVPAMSAKFGDGRSTIYVAEELPRELKRFLIAIELGHSLIDASPGGGLASQIHEAFSESRKAEEASREWPIIVFGLALLMPAKEVRLLAERTTDVRLLAEIFQVPENRMAQRLNMLGLSWGAEHGA